MFLADRYVKGTCPKCGAADQNGDACEVCGTTYAPTDLVDPYSALTGAKPELRQSEHLFFRLSDPQVVAFLEQWTKATPLQPEVFNKIQEWLGADAREGGNALGDWDISRDAPYFGIDIPDAPGKYFYVWLDAPIGYLAALKKHFDSGAARRAYPSETRTFDQFVADPAVEQYHFIGKDIIYFHTLFWPAMLHFSGRRTPTNVFVHGFLVMASGEKMSKSRGTGISPQRYVELGMNPEWLRYYIAAKLNDRVEDLEFNPDDFVARVNSDLVGKYVNIASRAAGFVNKHFGGELAFSEQRGEAPRRRARGRVFVSRPNGTTRASTGRSSATPWRSPTASTRRSTRRSPGRSPRIRRAAPSCRTSARARCRASSCSRSCSRRSCRRRRPRWREPSSVSGATSSGRTAPSLPDAHRRVRASARAHRSETDRRAAGRPKPSPQPSPVPGEGGKAAASVVLASAETAGKAAAATRAGAGACSSLSRASGRGPG